jgi:hypothetical protein
MSLDHDLLVAHNLACDQNVRHRAFRVRQKALVLLALGSSLVTALLEATWYKSRRGFEVSETLRNNFSLTTFDIGIPPVWQVLTFGLVFVFGAICSEAFRNAGDARAQQSKA